MRRLLVLLVVALGLAPGTWVRSPVPPPDRRQILEITALSIPPADLGPLDLTGVWQLDSPNDDFGGFSALVSLGGGTLLAASDRGSTMEFSTPGTRPSRFRIGYSAVRGYEPTTERDLEALARDPASGRIWAAFETVNRIERYEADFTASARVWPDAMRSWSVNQGAEAMVRLADGRFIVLAEGTGQWFRGDMPGLLFPTDPVESAEPIRFHLTPPAGFRPVDLAQLPDGRVLILLRKVEWGLPPTFAAKLVVADPAEIAAGRAWRAAPVADLAAPLPADNYEGLTVESDGRGGATLWVISDDNDSRFQRTLLLRLVWRANDKARGVDRAPQ
ncbi:MAG TPA: esterase-like activity of phytase family protein [Croceibacterium sp.]